MLDRCEANEIAARFHLFSTRKFESLVGSLLFHGHGSIPLDLIVVCLQKALDKYLTVRDRYKLLVVVGIIVPAMIVSTVLVAVVVDSDGVSQGAVREVHGESSVVVSKKNRGVPMSQGFTFNNNHKTL
jgi:hypothetical protein